MNEILGAGNGLVSYIFILLIYAALVVVMKQGHPGVTPEARKTYAVLYFTYAIIGFVANYLLYLAGVMSFLPWLNNIIHTFVWLGFCLGFLYIGAYRRPLWEQLVMFAIFSFVVKLAEHQVLGTWEMDHFFFVPGNLAYMFGWSLVDGLIPVGSMIWLKVLSKYVSGLLVPQSLGGEQPAKNAESAVPSA
jgi:hypothetical protein